MKRTRLFVLLGAAVAAFFALAQSAYAVDSLVGTLTAASVLDEAAAVLPYFQPVVLIVLSIAGGIFAINWVIAKVRSVIGSRRK